MAVAKTSAGFSGGEGAGAGRERGGAGRTRNRFFRSANGAFSADRPASRSRRAMPSPLAQLGARTNGSAAVVLGRIERGTTLGREQLDRAPRELAGPHVPVLPPADGRERDAQSLRKSFLSESNSPPPFADEASGVGWGARMLSCGVRSHV